MNFQKIHSTFSMKLKGFPGPRIQVFTVKVGHVIVKNSAISNDHHLGLLSSLLQLPLLFLLLFLLPLLFLLLFLLPLPLLSPTLQIAAVVLPLVSFAPQEDIPHKYILQDAPKEELEIVFYLKPLRDSKMTRTNVI